MKTAWLKLSAVGFVFALTGSACKIESGDGEGGTGGGSTTTGGKSSTGGTTSTGGIAGTGGAKATGGTTSTGGSKATGGTTSTGGKASTGGVLGCSNNMDQPKSTPTDTCDFPPESLADPVIGKCLACITSSCCDEVKACYGTDPDNQCGYGGLEKPPETEYICYQDCLVAKGKAKGGQYEPDDQDVCADHCATPACGIPPVGNETLDLITCMHKSCDEPCFLDPAM